VEEIIRIVTQEVLRTLGRDGTSGACAPGNARLPASASQGQTERIDMAKYRTPLVGEHSIARLHELTARIIVPAAAVITPRAKELIREKKIEIIFE
jgi:hypothetical protein